MKVLLISDAVVGALRSMALDEVSPALDKVNGELIKGSTSYFVSEKIGDKRAMTPDGFLLCRDVPLARIGDMVYGPNETPLKVGDAGYIIINRSPEEVFKPEFLASFEGKPVVNGHPGAADGYGVTPGNWKRLAVGTTINPRRGDAPLDGFIVADLLITDAAAIKDVLEGKREVSAGYATDWVQVGAGRGRQENMMANHVALVHAGRCGGSCSIGDEADKDKTQPTTGGDVRTNATDNAAQVMALDAKHPLRQWWDGVCANLKGLIEKGDKAAIDAALAAAVPTTKLAQDCGMARDEEAHSAIASINERLTGIDNALTELRKEKEDKDGDKGAQDAAARAAIDALVDEVPAEAEKLKVATDSALMGPLFQDAVSGAEILLPGITLPKFDAKAAPALTLDAIRKLRKTALDLAYTTPQGRALLDGLLAGRRLSVDTMDPKEVRGLFNQAVVARKAIVADQQRVAATQVNRSVQQRQQKEGDAPKRPVTPKEINDAHRKRWPV